MAIGDMGGGGTGAGTGAEGGGARSEGVEIVAFSTFLTIGIAARQKEMATFATIII